MEKLITAGMIGKKTQQGEQQETILGGLTGLGRLGNAKHGT